MSEAIPTQKIPQTLDPNRAKMVIANMTRLMKNDFSYKLGLPFFIMFFALVIAHLFYLSASSKTPEMHLTTTANIWGILIFMLIYAISVFSSRDNQNKVLNLSSKLVLSMTHSMKFYALMVITITYYSLMLLLQVIQKERIVKRISAAGHQDEYVKMLRVNGILSFVNIIMLGAFLFMQNKEIATYVIMGVYGIISIVQYVFFYKMNRLLSSQTTDG